MRGKATKLGRYIHYLVKDENEGSKSRLVASIGLYRGTAKNFRQVRPPYHWQLGDAAPLPLLGSISKNQVRTVVLGLTYDGAPGF